MSVSVDPKAERLSVVVSGKSSLATRQLKPNCTLLQAELPGSPQELRTLEAGMPLNLYNNLPNTNRTDSSIGLFCF
jgi:hypothetical protein